MVAGPDEPLLCFVGCPEELREVTDTSLEDQELNDELRQGLGV